MLAFSTLAASAHRIAAPSQSWLRASSLAFLCALTVAFSVQEASAQEVDHRPIVLTGADVPDLIGATVTAPVCYAYRAGAWEQCPIQIDERANLDPASNYPVDHFDAPNLFGGEPQLLYTAPQDYPMPGFAPKISVDPDPALDADDEVVLMARFFGDVVSPASPPFAPATVTEVLFEGQAVYLFVPTTPLDQSAGIDLVSYNFDLLSGTFPETYDFDGRGQGYKDVEGDFLAANPEYSLFESDYYRTSFEDRWIQRELFLASEVGNPASFGDDLLDRMKLGTRPDFMGKNPNCSRSIYTGSARRGTLGIQKDGPIRALRVVQGSNSGGLNIGTYKMYDRTLVYDFRHQMHSTPGTSMFIDYAPTVAGMEYYSNQFPSGVTVDGIPDRPAGQYYQESHINWDYLIGAQGLIVTAHDFDSNIPDPFPYSYYEDNTTPEVSQCTGDTATYASSGNVYMFGQDADGGKVPWTDPVKENSYVDGVLREMFYSRDLVLDGRQRTTAEADSIVTQLQAPIVYATQSVVTESVDLLAPLLAGSYADLAFEGTATDDRLDDTGIDAVVLGSEAVNLALAVDLFTQGDGVVAFTATPSDSTIAASGYVIATDVEGNSDSLLVEIIPPLPDEAAPVLAGTLDQGVFTGTVTDSTASDTGIATVALDAAATNLDLAVDPFTAGDPLVSFTATPTDPALTASGYVIATDVEGNADSLLVEIAPPPPDEALPVLTGTLADQTFTGSATDSTAFDTGIAAVALDAAASNLGLVVDPFSAGDPLVTFTATPTDSTLAASGYVIATDVAGNADSLLVQIDPPPPDETRPVLAGTLDTGTFAGTATDSTAFDTGIASVALDATATNLALAVDPFTQGADVVAFTATATDASQMASGYVIATDVAGNADSLLVEITPPPDEAAPVLAGTLSETTFAGTATDSTAFDTGIATVALDAAATNLEFVVDPFTAGDPLVSFTATPTDSTVAASGYVIATDVAGNADSLLVQIAPPPPDEALPVLAGTLTDQTFTGSATDSTASDTGIAAVTLDAAASNLGLAVDPFTAGDNVVTFTVTPTDPALAASGYVIATDVAGNTDSLFVQIDPPPADETAPVLAGAIDGDAFAGTASDSTAADTGLATLALDSRATNLTLVVDAFDPGAATASFSVTLTDSGLDGSGYVVATDVAGNSDSLLVALDAPAVPDTALPVLAGTLTDQTFSGTATDSTAIDTGLATVALDAASTNLSLAVDPFTAGDPLAAFTATPIDGALAASGYVIATDVAGNADSLLVEIEAVVVPDTSAPVLAGALTDQTFSGSATDSTASDTGLASIALAVDATNLALAADAFDPGAATASFTVTLADAGLAGSGYVIATDVAGNADSLLVQIDPAPPTDETLPVLAGTLTDQTFTGSATDSTASDTGIATVALDAAASNLGLAVDPFTVGDDVVTFTATPTDALQAASGYVIATDVAGNADSLLVQIEAPAPSDTSPPVLAGALDGGSFTGTVTDSTTTDTGLASVALGNDATNLTLDVPPFTTVDAVVSFTVTPTDPALAASGYVIATDVAGNTDSLFVQIDPPPPPSDEAAPVLAGAIDGDAFAGTASDSTATDSGLATVALDAASTNLSLAVDPFTAGDPLAAFTATPIDGALAASGYVIATDVAGNADSLLVEIEAVVVPDTSAPVLAGTLTDQTFTGSATDDTATDTGIATVALDAAATNLSLAVDPFTPGDATVSFTATPIDAAVSASGYVVATDVAGNADSLFVEIESLSSGMPFDLTYAIAYAFDTETSGTITVSAVNIGTEDMNRVRVKLTATQDVSVSPERINLGAVPAGSSKDAVFTFSDAGPDASARFRVQDLDVRIADEDNPDNNIGEVVLVPVADQAPPVLSGAYAAESFDGSASDSATDDTGIAAIALGEAATNLTLVVDPFTAGVSSVGFMAMPTDPTLDASGYVVATDVQGNADSLFVEFDAPDTLAPALTGTYSRSRFDGTATDNDTGVATVTLRGDATNLALAVDPFTAGDATVSFAATPLDAATGASGYLIATDVAGNADSLFVDIAPPPPDETRPVLTGTLADQAFSGVATDSTTIDTGLASVMLSAGTTNLDLAVDPFTEGDATVAFTATPTDGALAASGYVVATDVVGNTDSLFVDIAPPPPDETAPVLAGTVDGSAFTGTATDQAPTDEGLASVVLDAAASNLTLVVDAFGPGAATVSFTVTLTDTGLLGSGYVVATDVAGNADSLLVQIEPVLDEDAPVLTGSYGRRDFSGTASDDRSGDTGLASVTLRDAVNMSISVASFTPGASSTTYTVTLINNREAGEGYVVATDVAGNESELFVSSAESGRRVTSDASATGDGPENAAGLDASDGLGAGPDDTGADRDLADAGSTDRSLDAGRSGEPSASSPREQDDVASLDAANDAGPAENTGSAADDERGTRADRAPDRKPADDESPAERLDASEADREDRTAASPEADRAAAKPDRASGNDSSDVNDRVVEGTADASEAGVSEADISEADAPEAAAPRTTDMPAAQATIPDAFEVDVYPNPGGVRRSMTLRLPEDMALSVTVTDVLGRRVFEQRTTLAAGVHRLDLDLGALAAGTYVLDVTADSARRVVRLSVSR